MIGRRFAGSTRGCASNRSVLLSGIEGPLATGNHDTTAGRAAQGRQVVVGQLEGKKKLKNKKLENKKLEPRKLEAKELQEMRLSPATQMLCRLMGNPWHAMQQADSLLTATWISAQHSQRNFLASVDGWQKMVWKRKENTNRRKGE